MSPETQRQVLEHCLAIHASLDKISDGLSRIEESIDRIIQQLHELEVITRSGIENGDADAVNPEDNR